MPKRSRYASKNIAQIAEQQMRQWSLGQEVRERIEKEPTADELPAGIHPYVSVSRECGAAGAEVADLVGEQLDWTVLDKELLELMADKCQLRRDMLDFVDETAGNWLLEVFGKWINQRVVTQSEYIVHLGEMVLMAAQHASTVFVGRGSQFLLPREKGLAVYIIAPLEMRIERIMQEQKCSRGDAKRFVKETDNGRSEFIQNYFQHDVDDARQYDLVINREQLDLDQTAALIVDQCRQRFGE